MNCNAVTNVSVRSYVTEGTKMNNNNNDYDDNNNNNNNMEDE